MREHGVSERGQHHWAELIMYPPDQGPPREPQPGTPTWQTARMGSAGIAISLFAGAGGLDLGVEAAGFRVAAAVEMTDDAADTMEKNFQWFGEPRASA